MLPGDWERANVAPVQSSKRALKLVLKNYASKMTLQVIILVETLVRSEMMRFLDENKVIANFMKRNPVLQTF